MANQSESDTYLVYHNYSNGYIIEIIPVGSEPCESYLLLPAENLWSKELRGFLYILAMLYSFVGIAIVSDIFMMSIEVITSKKRTIVRWDEEKQERVERQVMIWNETVANLTLMALGSSAPEIMLAVVETLGSLGEPDDGGLGTFTIIGSAAFNLLVITAVCIVSVPTPNIKKIREVGVFVMTSIWSIFAYLWMLIVLEAISPGEIEMWEGWVTLAFFPVMVLMAYCQDNGWWCKKRDSSVGADDQNQVNVRVINDRRHSILHGGLHGMSKELAVLERERNVRISHTSLKTIGSQLDVATTAENSPMGSQTRLARSGQAPVGQQSFARAKFRHAAVRSMLGGRKHNNKIKFADVVDVMAKQAGITQKDSEGFKFPSDEELLGKFTFASPSYSVLESAGILEIDILFHRRPPIKSTTLKVLNGGNAMQGNGLIPGDEESSFSGKKDEPQTVNEHSGIVTVEYETREGSGKVDKDFKFVSGTLVFKETEYRKTITIPIINDNQYEADVDFYVILKNPQGDAGLSDPNITRVTIIDDDEPGEFQFDEPHYLGDPKSGVLTANVVRQKGCDGYVSIEYSTIDGTAKGGEKIEGKHLYVRSQGTLEFKHGETTKPVMIPISTEAKGSKNFIITLRNPSLGAKIGKNSAAVANITSDDLADRLAGIIGDDEEEEMTWGDQFKAAMVLEAEQDEDGEDIPLTAMDYILHFLTFFWKLIFAFIPPRQYLGAWPSFVLSLLFIGGLTFLVQQFGELLSCVIGLKASVAGITIIALGTSLPDTFASRTAALHDEGADAAIGNVTGSNSVNVFLGLGLPWVIKSIYAYINDETVVVNTDNLVSSVVIFSIVGTICIFLLLLRRRFVGGELGGERSLTKWLNSVFLLILWLIYIILSSIKAYYPDSLPW